MHSVCNLLLGLLVKTVFRCVLQIFSLFLSFICLTLFSLQGEILSWSLIGDKGLSWSSKCNMKCFFEYHLYTRKSQFDAEQLSIYFIGLPLLHMHPAIDLRNSRNHLNQSDAKPNSIASWSSAFSRASDSRYFFFYFQFFLVPWIRHFSFIWLAEDASLVFVLQHLIEKRSKCTI